MLHDYESAANKMVLVVEGPLSQLDFFYAADLHGVLRTLMKTRHGDALASGGQAVPTRSSIGSSSLSTVLKKEEATL